jgi:2-polyprenyl-6-methoxyphenol hydroxylase-like FAD-dependent oxidoreductase
MWRFQVSHRKRSLASLEFRMDDRPLIIGAGPTGLVAALFLAIRGVLGRITDQAGGPEKESGARVIIPRSLELLEPTGVVEAMLTEGHSIHRTRFYDGWDLIAELEFGGAHPRYEMTVLPQARTVALARGGLQPERGDRFEALSQDGAGVIATLLHADDSRETTMLLGVDGAHSRVRKALGISFEGSAFPEPRPLYDIHLNDPLDFETAHVSLVKRGNSTGSPLSRRGRRCPSTNPTNEPHRWVEDSAGTRPRRTEIRSARGGERCPIIIFPS